MELDEEIKYHKELASNHFDFYTYHKQKVIELENQLKELQKEQEEIKYE